MVIESKSQLAQLERQRMAKISEEGTKQAENLHEKELANIKRQKMDLAEQIRVLQMHNNTTREQAVRLKNMIAEFNAIEKKERLVEGQQRLI